MFIFIFQTIWLFIGDFAGKGLDIEIIGKFLFYILPNLIDKVLPLTVLLSSILTFGTFAENYEFAAMKASGISLQKAMRSLIVFVIFLGIVTFYFSDTVIPVAEQKIYNLRRNIAKIKPAIAITEGVFSDFEGTEMNIKVDKKYGEQDRFLDNVIIHQKTKTGINNTVIRAKTGELISSEDSDILQLVLKDVHYYQEVKLKSTKNMREHPFAYADFDTYIINIDLSELNNVDLDAQSDVSTNKMKNISRLTKDIDSLKKNNIKIIQKLSKNITARIGAFITVPRKDSTLIIPSVNDSINNIKDVLLLFTDWQQIQLINSAKNTTANIVSTIQSKKNELRKRREIYNRHILSLHEKFALAISCIILFFVGAPLGAIIRKGGIGLPMVIAVILFLTYYFIGVFATNTAKNGNIHPILGAWLSTFIMLPLGIFLTKRATSDKGLINFGSIIDFFKDLFQKKNKVPKI